MAETLGAVAPGARGPLLGLKGGTGLLRVATKRAVDDVYTPPTAHAGCGPMPASERARAGRSEPERCPHLSPVSRLFLGMGDCSPDIYAVLWLRGCATLEEIAWVMERMTAAHDRFRMRIVPRAGDWCTEMVEDFDVRWCMRETTLPGDDAEQAFDDFIARLMSGAPLTQGALPPWDCSVVHFQADPTRTGVLLRCSHMIGDGQLFMSLLQDVVEEVDDTDDEDSGSGSGSDAIVINCDPSDAAETSSSCLGSPFAGSSASLAASSGDGSGGGSASSDCGASGSGASNCGGSVAAGSAVSTSPGGSPLLIRAVRTRSAFLPPPSLERKSRGRSAKKQRHKLIAKGDKPKLVRSVQRMWGYLTSAWFVVTLPFRIPDPVNAVKAGMGDCSGPRAFASTTLPLDELRRVGDLLGVTINTLAASCVAGGLRRYLQQSEGGGRARNWWRFGRATEKVPKKLLLCSMVDTRAMRRDAGLDGSPVNRGCNTMSFIGVPLHTGDAPPLKRLGAVADSLKWIRNGFAVFMAVLMPPVVQFLVRDASLASRVILFCLPSKTTLGFSNMRGPQRPVMMRGHLVERLFNGVQPNAFGSFISLMSYDNQVTLVHSCYERKTKDPAKLLACVREEWEALRAAATQLPSTNADAGSKPAAGKRLVV